MTAPDDNGAEPGPTFEELVGEAQSRKTELKKEPAFQKLLRSIKRNKEDAASESRVQDMRQPTETSEEVKK